MKNKKGIIFSLSMMVVLAIVVILVIASLLIFVSVNKYVIIGGGLIALTLIFGLKGEFTRTKGIFIGILVLTGLIFIFASGVLQVVAGFTPIFCDDYEFTCCNEIPDFSRTEGITDEIPWKCPLTASKCVISSATGEIMGSDKLTVGSRNCKLHESFFGDFYECDNDEYITVGYEMKPGEEVFIRPGVRTRNLDATIQVKGFKPRLDFTGKSAASTGVPVRGADGCKFNPEKDKIYTESGTKQFANVYTLPLYTCVLSYSGDRHICGYKEETCSINSDCGGHTYGNQECSGRTLQTYGCKSFGTSITGYDRLPWESGWGSDDTKTDSNTFGKRCGIISAESVTCCSSGDCGVGMFCDILGTWTCKEESGYCTKLTESTICGVEISCDWTTKELVEPLCNTNTNKCYEKRTSVDCCMPSNCPEDYYCDADYKCEKSIVPKQECTAECCIGLEQYYDKPCESGEFCIDGKCTTSGCVTNDDCPTGQICKEGNCIDEEEFKCEGWYEYETTATQKDWKWYNYLTAGLIKPKEITTPVCKLKSWVILSGLGIIILVLGSLVILTRPKSKKKKRK